MAGECRRVLKNEINGGGGVKEKDDKSWCCGVVWGVGFAWVAEKGVASLW